MKTPTALRCLLLISPACVLPLLQACETVPEVVYRDRPVEVPVPVVQKFPDRLTRDCPPDFQIPISGPLTVDDAQKRLASVEFALATCRMQLWEIREAPTGAHP